MWKQTPEEWELSSLFSSLTSEVNLIVSFMVCRLHLEWSLVVLEIGQNFEVDHPFCKTDWSLINNRFVEDIVTLN